MFLSSGPHIHLEVCTLLKIQKSLKKKIGHVCFVDPVFVESSIVRDAQILLDTYVECGEASFLHDFQEFSQAAFVAYDLIVGFNCQWRLTARVRRDSNYKPVRPIQWDPPYMLYALMQQYIENPFLQVMCFDGDPGQSRYALQDMDFVGDYLVLAHRVLENREPDPKAEGELLKLNWALEARIHLLEAHSEAKGNQGNEELSRLRALRKLTNPYVTPEIQAPGVGRRRTARLNSLHSAVV